MNILGPNARQKNKISRNSIVTLSGHVIPRRRMQNIFLLQNELVQFVYTRQWFQVLHIANIVLSHHFFVEM